MDAISGRPVKIRSQAMVRIPNYGEDSTIRIIITASFDKWKLHHRESIKEDVVEVKVSDQSSIVSRSISSSEEILEPDEEAKDQTNENVKIKAIISVEIIEELDIKSRCGSYYVTEALWEIADQIIIKSNEETDTKKISSCYGVASESVSSKILSPRTSNFSIIFGSPENEVVEDFRERGSSRPQHDKTQQGADSYGSQRAKWTIVKLPRTTDMKTLSIHILVSPQGQSLIRNPYHLKKKEESCKNNQDFQ
ncbi:hypothetical protein FXO38_11152 [Capsicum annuum]|nr:hypothetical protein FXO38_11152 [Capsicum annuum]